MSDPVDVEKLAEGTMLGRWMNFLATLTQPQRDEAAAIMAAMLSEREAALREQGERTWRCFGCGEVFTDESKAAVHFGEDGQPAVCNEWARADAKERRDLYEQALLELSREQEHGMKREAEVREQGERLREAEYPCNLLAVIHRDGGHYIEEHGLRKATDDAVAAWYALQADRDGLAEREKAAREGAIKVAEALAAAEARLREAEAREGADRETLRRLLAKVANDAAAAWNQDRDSRVGKILIALAGRCPGYRVDIDAIHAALRRPPDARPAEPPADPPKPTHLRCPACNVMWRRSGETDVPGNYMRCPMCFESYSLHQMRPELCAPPSSEGPCPCGRPDRNHTHLREGR